MKTECINGYHGAVLVVVNVAAIIVIAIVVMVVLFQVSRMHPPNTPTYFLNCVTMIQPITIITS